MSDFEINNNDLVKFVERLSVLDSLDVLHYYQQFQLPKILLDNSILHIEIGNLTKKRSDIDLSNQLLDHTRYFMFQRYVIEIFKYSGKYTIVKDERSLRFTKNIHTLHDLVLKIDEEITKEISSENKFSKELFRMLVEQINLQKFDMILYFSKFYHIFQGQDLKRCFNDSTGCDIDKYMSISFEIFMFGFLNLKNKFKKFESFDEFNYIIEHGSINIQSLKDELLKKEQKDVNYFYSSISGIVDKPIIKIEDGNYIIPCPFIFLKWIFEGLYYRLAFIDGKQNTSFTQSFGNGFEQGLLPLILKEIDNNKAEILNGHIDTSKSLGSTDRLIFNDDICLFIECKSKFLTYKSWSDVLDKNKFEKDIKTIGEAIQQTYDSIKVCKEGKHPEFSVGARKVFNLVITPMDRLLDFNISYEGNPINIDDIIRKELSDPGVTADIPYFIIDVTTLDKLVHIINTYGLSEVFEKFKSGINEGYSLGGCIFSFYPNEEYSYLSYTNDFLKTIRI